MSALTVLQVSYPFACVGPAAVGGAEQILTSLDRALVAHGHRSLVLAPEGSVVHGELIALPGIPETVDPAARAFAYAAVRRTLARVVAERRVDVVHLHGVDFAQYLPEQGPPCVVTLHLSSDHYPELSAARGPDLHLVCVSETQRRAFARARQDLSLVPNGIDLDALTPRVEIGDYAVCLGRICPEKGFHFALDAAARIGLPIRLAGAVHPYDAHRRYFDAEIRPRLSASSTFLGPVDPAERRTLLAHARCLVVPSLVAETSCLVAMEALASGTPVVALDRGALRELVVPGRTGLLVQTPDALADAIAAVGAIDRAGCRRMAEERFPAARMHDGYLRLYGRLTRAERRAS